MIDDIAIGDRAELELERGMVKRSKESATKRVDRDFDNALVRRERARELKRLEDNRKGWIELWGRRHEHYLFMANRAADQRARLIAEAGYSVSVGRAEDRVDGPSGEAA